MDFIEIFMRLNSKMQAPNVKEITMTKIQNLKRFGHWILEFICYLIIEIWCFRTWSFLKMGDNKLGVDPDIAFILNHASRRFGR